MAGRFLLDTNVVIALLNGDTSVTGRLAQADEVFVSIIVLGELYFGAHKSERVDENIAHINEFAATSAVLGCDTNTADHYGLVKHWLRERGRPIPENDIWIAATAQQHSLTLVSRDEHFGDVDGLNRESW